mmetsp:Transcript_47361/g.122517  ORF Transcript_47361/g.122517 Transcript_47361/m.122517 type:complete len:174 (-) Transcript_47361:2958-3479(-)
MEQHALQNIFRQISLFCHFRLQSKNVQLKSSVSHGVKSPQILRCLGRNRISPPGASCLADYLSLNPPLQTLSLSHNRLGDQGAQAIARALRSNRNLTNLSLRGCGIGEDGLIALADAISSNPSICSFQLWGNSFSRKAAKAFHDLLKDSDRGFAHIDFFTNEVDEQIDIVRVE